MMWNEDDEVEKKIENLFIRVFSSLFLLLVFALLTLLSLFVGGSIWYVRARAGVKEKDWRPELLQSISSLPHGIWKVPEIYSMTLYHIGWFWFAYPEQSEMVSMSKRFFPHKWNHFLCISSRSVQGCLDGNRLLVKLVKRHPVPVSTRFARIGSQFTSSLVTVCIVFYKESTVWRMHKKTHTHTHMRSKTIKHIKMNMNARAVMRSYIMPAHRWTVQDSRKWISSNGSYAHTKYNETVEDTPLHTHKLAHPE